MRPPFLLLRTLVLFLLAVFSPLVSWSSPVPDTQDSSHSGASVAVPGPLRSFLRMAGISQKVPPSDVLPLLSRNIFLEGYEGPVSGSRQTEFLVLLIRYVQQAKDLAELAGPNGVIHV